MNRLLENISIWIAQRLPYRIRHWSFILLVSEYSSLHPDIEVPSINAVDVLNFKLHT